mmetsp:Transcript_41032/g.102494  ORF Transcript_41032/g.102494 Transcript_41032/m.102494 type:complete len:80 (-) Transcript_41032:11-250(-)
MHRGSVALLPMAAVVVLGVSHSQQQAANSRCDDTHYAFGREKGRGAVAKRSEGRRGRPIEHRGGGGGYTDNHQRFRTDL